MGNCLVTRLKDSVNNSNLKILGELRLLAISNGTIYIATSGGKSIVTCLSGSMSVGGVSKESVEIDSSYANITVTSGTKISVSNKYVVSQITSSVMELTDNCTLEDLYYSPLTALTLTGNTSGSIDGLNVSTLTTLGMDNTKIEGSVDIFASSNILTSLQIRNTKVGGNLSSLVGKSLSSSSHFNNSELLVDVEDIARMSSGNDVISKYVNCYLYGDVSKVGANVYHFETQNAAKIRGQFSWSGGRHNTSGAKIISNGYTVNVQWMDYGNALDAMLLDQAQCEVATSDTAKVIYVWGTHTANSGWESAVATLKSKGYSVIINNVSL